MFYWRRKIFLCVLSSITYLSVQICDVNILVATAEIQGTYSKSMSRIHFSGLFGMKFD